MAFVVGTNIGFCASAPSGDPGGDGESQASDARFAAQFTSPAGATAITEIGWYQSDNSVSAIAYQVGVYADSSNAPGALVGTIQTGNSTSTSAGWNKYTGLSIAISGSTKYWLAVACASGGTPNQLQYAEVASAYNIYVSAETTLPSPSWSGGSPYSPESFAIYALYSTGGGEATLTQEGYRWRNDDGDEANATWAAAQDTGITAPANTTRRIRFVLDSTGDANAATYQLEYKEANAVNWTKVT